MTTEKANKVYDVLVKMGGADENMRDSFIYHHTEQKHTGYFLHVLCTEWRFQGKLGFGGKYRSDYNSVDCYQEDETKEILKLIEKINNKLKEY